MLRIALPLRCASSLVLLALCVGCQQPTPGEAAPVSSTTPTAPVTSGSAGQACVCYCLASWIGPIAAPDVPDAGSPSVNWIGNIETEVGTTYWDANVTVKTHTCGTTTVTKQSTSVMALAHHHYKIVRTRTWNWGAFAWGPWGPPTRTNGAVNNDPTALASTSPPSLPHCPTVGIPCP